MTQPAAPTSTTLRIAHVTRYHYEEPVSLSLHTAWLLPRDTATQRVTDTALTVEPEPRALDRWVDYYGNHVSFFAIETSHNELVVSSSCQVSLSEPPAIDPTQSARLEEVTRRVHAWQSSDELAALDFLMASPLVPRSKTLAAYATLSLTPERPLLVGVTHLMNRIFEEFRYDPNVTTVSTPVSEVLSKKHGVCQDFAHVMLGCLRSVGAPARYVSGYLVPDGKVVGAQASHAWVSVYCPDVGWVDFDPTNNVRPGTGHVTLAWGRDYSEVNPIRGVIQGGGAHTINVHVAIDRDLAPSPPAV